MRTLRDVWLTRLDAPAHPADLVNEGDEVWVRAKLVSKPKKSTLAFSNGWLNLLIVSDGMIGVQCITADVRNVAKEKL